MADKICPILMAGTMISNIYAIGAKGIKDTHLFYESVRCMQEKCEWFENGCPAHLEKVIRIPEFKLEGETL